MDCACAWREILALALPKSLLLRRASWRVQKMEVSQTQRQQIKLWHASLLKQMQLLQNHRHFILSQVAFLLALPLFSCYMKENVKYCLS